MALRPFIAIPDTLRQWTEWCRLQHPTYTVAQLPTNARRGDRAQVSDASGPTFLAAPVGGGAVVAPIFYNGAAWIVG